jgi:hypothetical protein
MQNKCEGRLSQTCSALSRRRFLDRRFLFETKESEELGETTVLQNRMHPNQQKFFDLPKFSIRTYLANP